MKLSYFRFDLPENLIATHPAPYRDESRMMVLRRDTKTIEHRVFKDIVEYFDEGDVMIVNNTKVFKARLYGKKEKTGASIEVFLLRELNRDQRLWDVLVDPARKIRVGNKLYFGEGTELIVAEVVDNTTSRGRTIRFLNDSEDEEFYSTLFSLGEVPIPKSYMKREPEPEDEENYQTLFAKHQGAVAPPAAGLHFSREILKWFEIKGVHMAEVTLHLGLGSFRKIEVEDLSKHKMDSEHYVVPENAVKVVNDAKDKKKKICCVGNSTLRAIESSVSSSGRLKVSEGWTEKFIFPPYEVVIPNCMITNFHAPKSAFFITSATFAGPELLKKAYKEAIKEKYRFLEYGDAMLIL